MTCGGYEKNIFFDLEPSSGSGVLRFRRPLLTVDEREGMSNWLMGAIPPSRVNHNLARIEKESESLADEDSLDILLGPFGVFRVGKSRSDESGPCESWELDPDSHIDMTADDALFMTDLLTPFVDHDLSGFMVDPVSSPITSLDLSGMNAGLAWAAEQGTRAITDTTDNDVALNGNAPDVPHDAVLLLKHYQTVVLKLFTPFRHSKTPWHIIFVPHVKDCLAALTLGESVHCAALSTFYGTLATSAFSLAGINKTKATLQQAQAYHQLARRHAETTVETAYRVPKPAKYKSILMALLTMVQVSILTSNYSDSDFYLLEAEKFIRLRGLDRRKSRKVRLLHHCYAFERIMHESRLVEGMNYDHRNRVRLAVETSGLVVYGQDSVSFRLGRFHDLGMEMMQIKDRDCGENDLHLEYPGLWSATLYPEIFGVSEPWVFLLSLIVRLGRENDGSSSDGANDNLSAKEFLARARAIEICIKRLPSIGGMHTSDGDHALLAMLDAMQHALSIYFYRRIYSVDSSMLQTKVSQVLNKIMRVGFSPAIDAYNSVRLIWPAFIAAAEAEDIWVRASFTRWFDSWAEKSGLPVFTQTLHDLQRIWREKSFGDLVISDSNPSFTSDKD